MATINFDAGSKFGGAASSPTNLSHTCTGSNRGLLVAIFINNSATVSSITYAGAAMAQVITTVSGTERYYLFRLENPASGSNTIVVTPSSVSGVSISIIGQSWTGVNQTGMVGDSASDLSALSSSTSFSRTLTPSSTPTRGFWFPREYSNTVTYSGGTNTVFIDRDSIASGLISCYTNESTDSNTYQITINLSASRSTFLNVIWGFLLPAGYAGPWATQFASSSSQYLSVPVSAIPFGTNTFSFATWFNPATLSVNQSLMMGAETSKGINIYLDASNNIVFSKPNVIDLTIAHGMIANTKFHIACTASASGMKIYINGKLFASNANSSNFVATAAALAIGAYISNGIAQAGWYANSSMHDVRFYSTELSASDVIAVARGSLSPAGLTHRYLTTNSFNDSIGANNLTASASTPTFTTSSTYVPITTLGITQLQGSSVATSLGNYWKLDETSGNAADIVGAVTLTNNGPATYSTGKIGNGVNFGSANSTKYLNTSNKLGISGGNITISIWANITTAPGTNALFNLFSQGAANVFVEYRVYYRDASGVKKLGIERLQQNVSFNDNEVTFDLGTSSWHHIVATYDGSKTYLYADGVLLQTLSCSGNGSAATVDHCVIGVANTNGSIGAYTSGLIDEVGVWTRPVSYDEILALNNNNAGLPYTVSAGINLALFRRRLLIK